MTEKRTHVRTRFSAQVRLTHPQIEAVTVTLRDISDGGAFLLTGDQPALAVGTEVSVQALDIAEDAPVVKARIVRVEPDGVALLFCRD